MSNTGQQKIRIILRAFDHKIIDEAAKLIIDMVSVTGAVIFGPVPLPVKIKKFTLNRSTFVNKDARDQYEIRFHKRLLDIQDSNPKTVDQLQNLSLPYGVEASIVMI